MILFTVLPEYFIAVSHYRFMKVLLSLLLSYHSFFKLSTSLLRDLHHLSVEAKQMTITVIEVVSPSLTHIFQYVKLWSHRWDSNP